MASAVITKTKTHLFRQNKVQGAVIMTHEAMQERYPKLQGNPAPPNAPIPRDVPLDITPELVRSPEVQAAIELRESQEASVFAEETHFLGVLATDLVVSIAVAPTEELKQVVADNFMENVERVTPDMSEVERGTFALQLIADVEGKVKTESAAALKAQNQVYRDNFTAIKDILMREESVEVLRKLAPYLKTPADIEINANEFSDELIMPTTNELEARLENLTDDTVSPARGITFIKKTGNYIVGMMHVTKDLILPPLDPQTIVMPTIDPAVNPELVNR